MDPIEARHKALELALNDARAGTPFTTVLKNAKMFADFTIGGTVPEEKAATE